MANRIAPPFDETVSKFCKDTGRNLTEVTNLITAFAAQYGEYGKNLNTMAWLWVQNQGMAPLPLKQSSTPFSTIDKPYLTLNQVLSKESGIGENTGFAIRGWVFGRREGKSSTGGPALYLTLADGTDAYDVNIYGKQVETVTALGINLFDAVYIKNAQMHRMNQNGEPLTTPRIQVSGQYAETKKITTGEFDLPALKDIPASPLDSLKPYQTALVKGLVFETNQREYSGCPNCMSKFKEKVAYGASSDCPGNPAKQRASCGRVTATRMAWTDIHINDQSGELKLSFGPSFDFNEEQLKALRFRPIVSIGYLDPESNSLQSRYMNTEEQFNKMASAVPTASVTPAPNPAPVSTVSTATPVVITPTPIVTTPTTATLPAPTVTTSNPIPPGAIASSLPPNGAVAPLVENWVRLMGPKTEAEMIKFMNEKKHIPVQAVKNTVKEMIEMGILVTDDTGKMRLA